MTSTRERQQRAAARARLAREMAERQAAAKKRRQFKIVAGAAAAVLLVLAGTVWAVTALTGDDPDPVAGDPVPTADPADEPPAAAGECVWEEVPEEQRSGRTVDVGTPPEGIEPGEGTQLLNFATSQGDITVEMDLALTPCIAASFAHLAGEGVYSDVKCHRAFDGVLQCGDPTVGAADEFTAEDGTGGPTYRYADENLPVGQQPAYPRGTLAMANSGPGTNGSQFFFVYQDIDLDGPNYAVVGTVVDGLDVLDEIGAEGFYTDDFGVTRPEAEVIIHEVTLDPPAE